MSFVQAKCPECGGMLAVDDSKKAAVCQFCGEAFIVQEAINNYITNNITNNTTNHNYGEGAVVNVYEDKNKDFVIEGGVLKKYHGASVDVVIPDGVIEISYECFKDLKIKTVVIPESVTSIRSEAFRYCTDLTSINVDENNSNYSSFDGVLFNIDKTILIRYPAGKSDTEYNIPDSVTSIGDWAFSGCTRLISVTIPVSVTSMGQSDFSECTSLERINWNAKNVGDFTSISDVFYNAGTSGNGIDLVFGDEVEKIPAYLCYVSSSQYRPKIKIKTVTVGNSVTSIGDWAFSGCTSLTSITIPDSVTSIGDGAFFVCTSLTSITIPDSVTSIGDRAFFGFKSHTDVNISDDLFYRFKWKFGYELQEEITIRKAKAKQAEKQRIIAERKSKGLCQYCGGTFKKGLFSSKCSNCGKPKDY